MTAGGDANRDSLAMLCDDLRAEIAELTAENQRLKVTAAYGPVTVCHQCGAVGRGFINAACVACGEPSEAGL